MTWTIERVVLLTSFWEEGLSTSRIGERMEVTRNAVIGKIHRLGLSRPRPKKYESYTRPKPKPRKTGFKPSTDDQISEAREVYNKAASTKADDLKIPTSQRKAFEQLKTGMCKFPVGNPGDPDFFFCGAKCERLVPYCDAHGQRCGGRRLK